jgi:hypothetical protein
MLRLFGRHSSLALALRTSLVDDETLPITAVIPKSFQTIVQMHHGESSQTLEIDSATVL